MKNKLKIIIPICLILFVVISMILSRMNDSSKSDYIITDSDNSVEDITNKSTEFEIQVDVNFEEETNKNGDTTIRSSLGSEATITDKQVLVTNGKGESEVVSIDELLEGNSPTNDNIVIDKLDYNDQTNANSYYYFDHLGDLRERYMPKSMCYDTDLVLRKVEGEDVYEGVLYNKYYYCITKEEFDTLNIDKYKLILSYSHPLTLKSEQKGTILNTYSLIEGIVYHDYYDSSWDR